MKNSKIAFRAGTWLLRNAPCGSISIKKRGKNHGFFRQLFLPFQFNSCILTKRWIICKGWRRKRRVVRARCGVPQPEHHTFWSKWDCKINLAYFIRVLSNWLQITEKRTNANVYFERKHSNTFVNFIRKTRCYLWPLSTTASSRRINNIADYSCVYDVYSLNRNSRFVLVGLLLHNMANANATAFPLADRFGFFFTKLQSYAMFPFRFN